MRFIHSYWSVPSLSYRWYHARDMQTINNLWYFALSSALIRKLGHQIILHTDELGLELFKDIPYTEVHDTLKNIPSWMNKSVWACGKMYALKAESLDAIHIDGDVLIKSQKVIDRINVGNEFDLICQSYEDSSQEKYEGPYISNMRPIKHLEFPKGTTKIVRHAYNTGLLKFNNSEYKDFYLDTYFSMAEKISHDQSCIEEYEKIPSRAPDIIIEQQFMYELSKLWDLNVKLLIDYDEDLHDTACMIGYQHLLGDQKYTEIYKCRDALSRVDNDLYNIMVKKELYLQNKFDAGLL